MRVVFQLIYDHRTCIKVSLVSYLSPNILRYNGNGHRLSVLIWIPVSRNVKPRIERGDNTNANRHDDGYGVLEDSYEVPCKYM